MPRTFTADDNGLCFVASLRTAASLIGLQDYLPDVCLKKFLSKHPEASSVGLTWQLLTKLMQLCDSFERKRKGKGFNFGGPRKKVNRVMGTISGKYPWVLEPGVYLCGVAMASAGHMFVMHADINGSITVHDSACDQPQPYAEADMRFVTRWTFVLPCVQGFL